MAAESAGPNLCDCNALVCGGSRGIGQAAAIALAALGANVTVLARNRDALNATLTQLKRAPGPGRHALIEADIADHELLPGRAKAAAGQPVHILINNTAGPPPGAIIEAEGKAFVEPFHRHLVASHRLAQALLPGMRNAGFGRIVNVISTSVKEPIAGLGVSNTVRAAVAAWAKTLASEVAASGITVNNVLPGFTRTERLEQIINDRVQKTGRSRQEIVSAMLTSVPAARFAEASEIAQAIAFLCTREAAYITGINLPVDGGRTHSL